MPLALKVQDAVHHVLQHLGSGDGALLIDVADDKNGEPLPFCQLHQGHGALLHLAYAARRGGQIPAVKGLDRVDNQNVGLQFVDSIH